MKKYMYMYIMMMTSFEVNLMNVIKKKTFQIHNCCSKSQGDNSAKYEIHILKRNV